MSIRTFHKHEWDRLKRFKCQSKANAANARFKADIICSIQVYELLERFNFSCIYCSNKLEAKSWHLDHFYSKAMGGRNIVNNLAPACKWCNLMKGPLDGYAFIDRCQKIGKNNVLNILFGETYESQGIEKIVPKPHRRPKKLLIETINDQCRK